MIEDLTSIQFSLETTSGIPFYKQIIHQVELGIADGRLQEGMKLPTVRSLAVELQINPNTVARAYNEMEIRNLVKTQQGSGTFIKIEKNSIDHIKREKILGEITRSYISHASSYGFTLEEIATHIEDLIVEKQLPTGGKS